MYNIIPKVEIVEQPAHNSIRFRYTSEGSSQSSVRGVNSTKNNRTYPAIRVPNFNGEVFVVVSCVTDDAVPKPHPNCLTGVYCARGVYERTFTTESAAPTVMKLENVGILCTKREDIDASLSKRKDLNIDPFNTGFGFDPKSIDRRKVRLCFQVSIKQRAGNVERMIQLLPILSNVIADKLSRPKLTVHEIQGVSSSCTGGRLILLFCDIIGKHDVSIKFYEEDADGNKVWEQIVKPKMVHKRAGISFLTPEYRDQNIADPVQVLLCLQMPTDESVECSDPIKFTYLPDPEKFGCDDSRSDEDIAPVDRGLKSLNFHQSNDNSMHTLNTTSAIEQRLSAKKNEAATSERTGC